MLALVMPTIHTPHVLTWYHQIAPDMPIFVIGDEQTPDDDVRDLLRPITPARYYSVHDQRQLGYQSCDLLNWRHAGRRSIGFLEAARAGADTIITADDDNLPLDPTYFHHFHHLVGHTFNGPQASAPNGWVDPAWCLQPPVHHRGFPHQLWHPFQPPTISSTTGARIGVAAGLWLGDPDIDAVTRITNRPTTMSASPLADTGFVVTPTCYSPFNSQNTAFIRDLLPVMLMLTPYGRFDDIWCSYLAQRVMRHHNWVVHYGQPYVWQQRSFHVLARDLSLEVAGMEATLRFTNTLDQIQLPTTSILDDAAHLYESLADTEFAKLTKLGMAWVHDVERVLG